MRKYPAIIMLAILFMAANCATTKITSFCDPEFKGKTFHRLLIYAPFKDIESRMEMENAFKIHFASPTIAVTSFRLIMPTRSYTDAELDNILMENKVDGIILIILTDAYSSQTYVPASSSTRGTASSYGNLVNYYATTQQYGGYYVSKPRVKYEIQLFDVGTKKIAWISSSLTRGNKFAGFGTMANSLAAATVNKLSKDGLLR
jgi:hypothetical protein